MISLLQMQWLFCVLYVIVLNFYFFKYIMLSLPLPSPHVIETSLAQKPQKDTYMFPHYVNFIRNRLV